MRNGMGIVFQQWANELSISCDEFIEKISKRGRGEPTAKKIRVVNMKIIRTSTTTIFRQAIFAKRLMY
jgi:hypothetical protein